MQLKKIQEALDQFKTHLASEAKEEHIYIRVAKNLSRKLELGVRRPGVDVQS